MGGTDIKYGHTDQENETENPHIHVQLILNKSANTNYW